MSQIGDYEDDRFSTCTSSTTYTHDPGRLVTHQSSEQWSDPEMLRQCPFDPVHVVQAYRYQRHILRCRKQNPEKAVDFRQCKFNAMHFHHKDKILQHEEECVDRARIERNRRLASGPCTRSATDDIPIHLEENWEIGNRGGSGKMIRPRREDILKLKQVLKDKYPNVEKTGGFEPTDGLFADTDSMYSTDGPSRYV